MCAGLLSSCVHCALHWESAPVNCVPAGSGPLAAGWHSRARSAPTTCLVPGRVTGLLWGGLGGGWGAGCGVCSCVCCVCIICEVGGHLQPGRRWKLGGAGSKVVLWRRSGRDGRGSSLGAAASESQCESACPSLGPSVCLPVHLHPELVSLSFWLCVCLYEPRRCQEERQRKGERERRCSSLSVFFFFFPSKSVIKICNTSVS